MFALIIRAWCLNKQLRGVPAPYVQFNVLKLSVPIFWQKSRSFFIRFLGYDYGPQCMQT